MIPFLIIFKRNIISFKKRAWGALISGIDPLLFLLAFGFGIGKFVPNVEGLSYVEFIAPAMVIISVLYGSFFETTYNAFVRMYYENIYTAWLSTNATVKDIVLGEMLWGAFRGTIYATIVIFVLFCFGLLKNLGFLIIILVLPLLGLTFASIGMFFTSVVPNIMFFDYLYFVYINPMILFSGTYFPINILPIFLKIILKAIFPLYYAVKISRELYLSQPIDITNIIVLLITCIFFTFMAIKFLRIRLID
ncbi:ABC-2 type transporter [Thermodesulfobium narugense DSM 14796]|uniref:Transport permease protein n=1 Tax=Thermodesulfobium narugense DSM 14796 TaxID=747365 RepID=M1E7A0_9BACT|nr:ABC transporter permease [Thermodesulfobium narugense]AEE15191.1 ABC-2 type transporter [Thermodesulfobium narugense DSM 14796]